MKQTTRARSRFKNLIYSSAILAALSPAVDVNAQGTEPAESNVLMENMDLSRYEPVLKEILEKEEDLMNQDLTLLKLIMTAREQHLEENFELASGLYNLLSTYPELDEALLKQIHTNETKAVNKTVPSDWTLNDEQLSQYESVIILSRNQISDLLVELNQTELVVEETEEKKETAVESDVPAKSDATSDESVDEKVEEKNVEVSAAAVSEKAETEKQPESNRVMTSSSLKSNEADDLYNKSVQSGSVTTAWYTAIEGYTTFPNDERFKDAIEQAGSRSLNYADRLDERGNTAGALAYYGRTLDSPWLSKSLEDRAQASQDRILKAAQATVEEKKQALYDASVKSGSVTTAWYKAVEGYNTYPNDDRFKDAIEQAGSRSLNYADRLEERGNTAGALAYYGRTLDSPWLSKSLKDRAQTSQNGLLNNTESKEEAKKQDLYNASVKSGSVTTAWYKAIEGYNAYPKDDRFKDAIEQAGSRSLDYADRLDERGNQAGALAYYGRTLDSPWLTSALKNRATTSQARVMKAIEEDKKEALYQASVNNRSVSKAWYTAIEGYNAYPKDDRFKDAIEQAAVRSLNYADSLESKGRAVNAIPYYERTLDSPWMTSALKDRASKTKAHMLKVIEEEMKAALYNESVNSSSVSTAWSKAIEGYQSYPKDDRFKEAIRRAAVRNLNYADSLKAKGNASSSIQYYDRIINSPWMTSALKDRAVTTKNDMMKYLDSDYVYQEMLNEGNPLKAWDIAIEAIVNHPKDDRIEAYIIKEADALLEDAIAFHKDYQYAKAVERYDALIKGPGKLYDEENIAMRYKILAQNDLIPNHASYQKSHYYASLEEALDEQMKRAPQTQSGGKWVNASREQTKHYLNPDNFLKSIENDPEALKVTGKVAVSALNVRSGVGTSYRVIDQIYNGKDVSIINEVNGWFEIKYVVSGENRIGWVSGNFVEKDSQEIIKHDFNEAYNPVARITATTLNVRQGPGTNNPIITRVSKGRRYKIVQGTGDWYQIDLGKGTTGWVSAEYVTVSNTLEKDLLQFVKLSTSSGISEAKLNEEIGNSGVLTGTGRYFLEASERFNINEIYLLAHAKLETGNGSSTLAKGVLVKEVDGKAVEPKVVYNMFGIAAFDRSPLKSGSEYAYKMGWDTVKKSIIGGAEWISKQYVNHATHQQDTLYKMRWNPLNPGSHQYATDIGWAYKQTHTLNTLVEVSQKYDLHLNFDVPVYNVRRLK